MCLILLAFHHHPDYPLVVAANRDEYYDRSSSPAHFWPDYPHLLAGQDHNAGGTWLGITKSGRFAAVTNFRDGHSNKKYPLSRGDLTKRFLLSNRPALEYLQGIIDYRNQYGGFNLIIGTTKTLFFYSNRYGEIQSLNKGIYGLSNGRINEDWPKVRTGKLALQNALNQPVRTQHLMDILSDRHIPADSELPNTGVGIEMERVLASRFIKSHTYGTRSSTVLTVDKQNTVQFIERNFDNDAAEDDIKSFTFKIV